MTDVPRISLCLGVFLTSLSAVVFEVTLTRIFSVTLWYHFAYFVVSMALFGLGAGGLATHFLRRPVVERFPRILMEAAALQFASIVLCAVVILNFRFSIGFSIRGLASFLLAYLVCSLPFVCTGFVLSAAFRNLPQQTPTIYAVDLAGAAVGCILFIAAITWVSGPAVLLLAAFLALLALLGFSRFSRRRLSVWLGVPLAVVALASLAVLNGGQLLRVRFAKYYDEQRLASRMLLERWSPLARITVWDRLLGGSPDRPFMWGASRAHDFDRPVPQLWIEQDASAGTPITRFRGDLAEVAHLRHDITSLAHHVKPGARTFVVGAGGGRDILTALSFGSPHVKACEINPVIVDAVRNRFREFAGGLFDLPQVSVEVGEARSHIRRSDQRYGIVQISLTDSFAATASGAFALAENSLYTVEAFNDYLRHLEEGGFLSVTRFLFYPRNQTLRVVTLARRSLEESGAGEPWKHIAVVGTDRLQGVATVLVKRAPLAQAEIARLATVARRQGWEALYLPGLPGDETFTQALTAPTLETFTRRYDYDVRPTTDDRPFFFQMIYFRNALDLIRGKVVVSGQSFNYHAVSVLAALLVISGVLTLLVYVIPLLFSRQVLALPPGWGLYFLLLGLGFMFVEIPLIQQGSLYLGHPTYGLTVVLFSLLISTGLGSYWSGSFQTAGLLRRLRRHMWSLAVLIPVMALLMEVTMSASMGAPLYVRLAIVVCLCGSLGLLLGAPFPSGIRLVGQQREHAVPWVWALNGGASVTGSIIAMAAAMGFGYRLTLLTGGLVYAAAALVLLAPDPRAGAVPAGLAAPLPAIPYTPEPCRIDSPSR